MALLLFHSVFLILLLISQNNACRFKCSSKLSNVWKGCVANDRLDRCEIYKHPASNTVTRITFSMLNGVADLTNFTNLISVKVDRFGDSVPTCRNIINHGTNIITLIYRGGRIPCPPTGNNKATAADGSPTFINRPVDMVDVIQSRAEQPVLTSSEAKPLTGQSLSPPTVTSDYSGDQSDVLAEDEVIIVSICIPVGVLIIVSGVLVTLLRRYRSQRKQVEVFELATPARLLPDAASSSPAILELHDDSPIANRTRLACRRKLSLE